MKKYATKIGAILYLLWGVIHIIGGVLMIYASSHGPDAFVKMMSDDMSLSLSSSNSLALLTTNTIFLYHSYNIVWIGIICSVIALKMNWKNSVTGFWLNFILVGFTDLGLLLFMVFPGVMTISNASPGLLLFIFALAFSFIGRKDSIAFST